MLPDLTLSRREREVMEIVHHLGRATAAEIRERMPNPPTDAAVRSTLRILREKGHLEIEQDGPRYIYLPTVPAAAARQSALDRVARTFFNGSIEGVMAALLESRGPLTREEKKRLQKLIDQAAEGGR